MPFPLSVSFFYVHREPKLFCNIFSVCVLEKKSIPSIKGIMFSRKIRVLNLWLTIVFLTIAFSPAMGLPVDEMAEEDLPETPSPDKEIAENDESVEEMPDEKSSTEEESDEESEEPNSKEKIPEKEVEDDSPPSDVFGRSRPDFPVAPGFGIFNRPDNEYEDNDGFDFGGDHELPNDKSDEDENTPDMDYGKPGEPEMDQPFPIHGSFFFDTPFFNMRQVGRYFQQLEKALQEVYEATVAQALNSTDNFANSTEEIVEMGGRKYKVQKTIIRGGDRNNSVFIEAISTHPVYNQTRRSLA